MAAQPPLIGASRGGANSTNNTNSGALIGVIGVIYYPPARANKRARESARSQRGTPYVGQTFALHACERSKR
jgi:hypothetical protein